MTSHLLWTGIALLYCNLIGLDRLTYEMLLQQGASSSTSTLTKLTSKLNFLKDRRSPPNELQSMDKGQELSHTAPNLGNGSELLLPLPSPKKSRGYDFHLPLPSPNKSRGYEFYLPLLSPNRFRGSESHSPPNLEKGPGKEGQSLQHPDKLRKSGSQPGHHSDKQTQYPALYLKRGKSEGHHHSWVL